MELRPEAYVTYSSKRISKIPYFMRRELQATNLPTILKIADFGQGMLNRDPVESCSHSRHMVSRVLVRNDTGQRIKIHQDRTYTKMTTGVHVRVEY